MTAPGWRLFMMPSDDYPEVYGAPVIGWGVVQEVTDSREVLDQHVYLLYWNGENVDSLGETLQSYRVVPPNEDFDGADAERWAKQVVETKERLKARDTQ